MYRLFVHNCAEIVQVTNQRQHYLAGREMSRLAVRKATLGHSLALAIDQSGVIMDIDDGEIMEQKYDRSKFENVIDAHQGSVMPGFVDAHTHPIWSGDRVHEFSQKLAGASYMKIHEGKGGIHFTVECTRKSSDEELKKLLQERLTNMKKSGTTAAECKTGYGLWFKDELRLLQILNSVKRENIIDMSLTYLGAHATPRDFNSSADAYSKKIADEDLPKLKELVEFANVDVFCEKGVFEIEATERILEKARKLGYTINFHAEELSCINGVELGCRLGARAMSHLERISDSGISAMAETKAAAVVLPTTAQILRLEPPPVRKMIDKGVIVALGSDFNPNAFCYSMPTVMHIACVQCHMSLEEALAAATINAAYSIGMSHRYGSIEVGKEANLVIIKEPKWEHIVYQLGCHSDLIRHVIYQGRVVG